VFTPEEIQTREFLVSLRGYDRDEVRNFLEQVAQQIRDLQSQLESLHTVQPSVQVHEEAPVPEAVGSSPSSADPKPFIEDLGQTTQRIVEAAYESAAEIQRRARSRAERELADARSQAAKLLDEGHRRHEMIEALAQMLEERRAALAEDLREVGRTIEQMLTDCFTPWTDMPGSDEKPLTVAQVTAQDEHRASETADERVALTTDDELSQVGGEAAHLA
jgi:DivIVA domain-containing protein